jgi:hypothetical protein
MPKAVCKFIKRVAEFQLSTESDEIPDNTRGIYVLLRKVARNEFDVVYVGMTGAGMWSRIKSHRKNKRLKWTHFTVFEVHDNITDSEIKEIEGLIRHIYRKDSRANRLKRANRLNIQLRHRPFLKVQQNNFQKWV